MLSVKSIPVRLKNYCDKIPVRLLRLHVLYTLIMFKTSIKLIPKYVLENLFQMKMKI